MLPDLFRAHPETRAVFDRYGLKGCGGTQGPAETIQFFSTTHGVEEARLLEEVREAIRRGPHPAAMTAAGSVADTIYRRYFTAGVLVVLTAGATWGAWLLWKIGLSGAFTSTSIHDVNAHGHAQIFGWVGLFIMGFAYQAFPRMWHTELVAPRLAVLTFTAMSAGLVSRVLGMTLANTGQWALFAAMDRGLLEAVAIMTFAAQILITFRRSPAKWQPYVGFVSVALGWFVVMSLASAAHTWNTVTAATKEELLWRVSTYQAPLRDIQIHGLALFMILGVSIRMLPALFEVPSVPNRRAWTALGVLLVAVTGEALSFVLHRHTGDQAWAATLLLAWALLAVGVALVALPWRLWRPLPVADRSGKFVRSAYGWLAVSLAMLMLLPVYLSASGMPFSHAYYGAIRHAVTVGFVSLMIMGVSAKVVPTLNGVDPRGLSALRGPFLLVNAGGFLRVITQALSDWHAGLFAVIGLSGTLEVAGLAWWGTCLVAVIARGKREKKAQLPVDAAERPSRIEPDHRVARVVAWFPQTEIVFLSHGFAAVRNPILRRTVARQVSLAQASALHGIEIESLIRELNAAIGSGDEATRFDV
jgi:hypothetical protein